MSKTVILKTSICVTLKNPLGCELVSGNGVELREAVYASLTNSPGLSKELVLHLLLSICLA